MHAPYTGVRFMMRPNGRVFKDERVTIMAFGLTKKELSWVLYDVGNSAFVMLSTALIPVYFASIADPGSSVVVAWGYAETVASLILALLMPVLGSLADLAGNKKKFLVGFAGTGAVACAALGIPEHALVFLVVYVIAAIMLNGSMVFYDAFLVDATTEERYDKVSSHGYAWGYIGSCIPFIACLAVVLGGSSFGIDAKLGMKIAFIITAVWWVIFTVPVAKNVKQLHGKKRSDHVLRTTISGLKGTVKSIMKDKRLLFFMLAFFFYIDGVHTVIKMSTSYGTDLGIDSTQLVLALLVTQFVAFPSAIAYGNLAKRFGTKRMLKVGCTCVLLYRAICGVLLEERGGILDPCNLRWPVPGRYPGAFAFRVRQAHSEGARQRVLRVLRHLRQVCRCYGHLLGKRLYPTYGKFFDGRAIYCPAVYCGIPVPARYAAHVGG